MKFESVSHEYREALVDAPNGDTSAGWRHPLAAVHQTSAEPEVGPVTLGPGNYGYVAPIPEGFIDSRPDTLSIYTEKRQPAVGHVIPVAGHIVRSSNRMGI